MCCGSLQTRFLTSAQVRSECNIRRLSLNILARHYCYCCRWLAQGAEAGDSLFMHYSGETGRPSKLNWSGCFVCCGPVVITPPPCSVKRTIDSTKMELFPQTPFADFHVDFAAEFGGLIPLSALFPACSRLTQPVHARGVGEWTSAHVESHNALEQ